MCISTIANIVVKIKDYALPMGWRQRLYTVAHAVVTRKNDALLTRWRMRLYTAAHAVVKIKDMHCRRGGGRGYTPLRMQ